jgi:hypothetical protein
MQALQILLDPCLVEVLSFIGNYRELISLGYEEFITRYPRCITKVTVNNDTIPREYVENATVVTISCIGYQMPPLLNCEELYCHYTKHSVLPDLPNCKVLNCKSNIMTSLPELPKCENLNCGNNMLTFLPNLPNCKVLNCMSNMLVLLPDLSNCEILN